MNSLMNTIVYLWISRLATTIGPIVGFENDFSAPWIGWGTACVVIGSLLISLLVMMVLVSAKQNKMLLYRMMPRDAIIAVEQGRTFVQRDSEATIFFCHLIGFNEMSGDMGSKDFLLMLTQLYQELDYLAQEHPLYSLVVLLYSHLWLLSIFLKT